MDQANRLTLKTALTSKYILLPDGKGGTIKIASDSTTARSLILKGVDGMSMSVSIDSSGNAVVNITCESGKRFDGWKTSAGDYTASGTVKLSSDIILTAKIK